MWEAERPDGSLVALKVLTPLGRARDDLTLRFQAEGGLLRRLGGVHHLVRCDAVIATPPTLVLEWFPQSLADRLTPSPLAFRVAMVMIRQVVDALGWLHEHGIVHRDVKPSNILIGEAGRVCLADLGVAAQGLPPRGLPDGWVEEEVGTLGYAAPELLRDPSAAGPSSDVYSLAVTLYEAVSETLPWRMGDGESDAAFRVRAAGGLVPHPLQERHAALEPILRRALDPEPGARFQSAGDFLAALEVLVPALPKDA